MPSKHCIVKGKLHRLYSWVEDGFILNSSSVGC
uniref:Uncharacterized protein n=1 Tax=Tetranychus urticae TaxID=32264 RepID=T1JSS4_TETUR